MRFTQIVALTAAAASISSPAGAQEPGASRVRIASPSIYRLDGEPAHRAALGIVATTSGTLRDTLGVMISSVTKGSPAEKAGLEEGNRIVAVNGVSLRSNAADVEDADMAGALTRRLTRELGKAKPGDEVELKVYRDGRTQTIKVKTADSDELFRRTEPASLTRAERENRPALGFSIGSTGSRRDTLGVLVLSVADSTPAAKAGIEEGNRIAAINGVNLRVAREDAGDRMLGSTKAQRLQREISALKPGDKVTLKVYSEGRFRDVTLKVARAGDLPRGANGMTIFGDGLTGMYAPMMPSMPSMPSMPAMPSMPSMSRMAPTAPMPPMPPMGDSYYEMGPMLRENLDRVRTQLREIEPELRVQLRDIEPQVRMQLRDIEPRVRMELDRARPQLERVGPAVQAEIDAVRPQLERMRIDMPRALERVRMAPRAHVVAVVV
jgi:serine protease Do